MTGEMTVNFQHPRAKHNNYRDREGNCGQKWSQSKKDPVGIALECPLQFIYEISQTSEKSAFLVSIAQPELFSVRND